MVFEKVKKSITPGFIIPKPEAKDDFIVKGWGYRRGQPALIYLIPNHHTPTKPYEKGITEFEFEMAYQEVQRSGELTRNWFNNNLSDCAKEGGCNFTTIGGIFQHLQIVFYSAHGVYKSTR